MTRVVLLALGRLALLAAAVALLAFTLPRALPGSPLVAPEVLLLPGAAHQRLQETYGLRRPWHRQLVDYASRLARLDLGTSLVTHRPVREMLRERLGWTALLVGVAWSAAAVVGSALGTLAAVRSSSGAVRGLVGVCVVVASAPEFAVAMVLILAFSVWLPVFPAGGVPWASAGPGGLWERLVEVTRYATLPAAALAASALPGFALTSRSLLAAVLAEPFVLAAQARGLPGWRVLAHAWRPALAPFLTWAGLRLVTLVTGAAAVERVFNYPGLGSLLFDAVVQRDYPVIEGVFLVGSWSVLVAAALLEVVARAVDPRLR
ncbi:MAG: ABC transporter permease [Armatimonadota bacterium]|nr:ABC transporter permease [Armatimonadota bacterium]MDW8155570.1 ABC transporter permease [Armatimonadota bacterium]